MKLDTSTLIGLLIAYALVLMGMILATGGDIPLLIALFVNQPDSAAITIGGSLGATICAFPLTKIKLMSQLIKQAFFCQTRNTEYVGLIEELIGYAKETRKSGILALDEKLDSIEDNFIKTGLQLAVDGATKEQLQEVLNFELENMIERHISNQALLLKWAEFAPAYGMIGTLVGLVAMLANLSDPDAIGPAMAVALITTLYGSMLANMVCIPLAAKLSNNSEAEILRRKIIIAGILAIQNGDNPAIVRQRLLPFIPPKLKEEVKGDD